jgi:hypothetical protein
MRYINHAVDELEAVQKLIDANVDQDNIPYWINELQGHLNNTWNYLDDASGTIQGIIADLED